MKKRVTSVSIPEINESLLSLPKDSNIFIEKAMAISKQIYTSMLIKRWLQKDLAAQLGKSEAEISKLLSGSHNFTLRTISRIEAVLDTNIIAVLPALPIKFETETNIKANYKVEKNVQSSKGNNWVEATPGKVIPFDNEKSVTQQELQTESNLEVA